MTETKIVALVHQKGGSGKSTLAQSLAVLAQQAGETVVVVDLDPQPTTENWADRRADENLHVVSAHPPRLPNVIQTARDGGVTLVIIDTPGKSEAAALAAAKAAHLVVIPCKPFINDIETLRATKDILALAGNPPAIVVLNECPPVGTRHTEAMEEVKNMGLIPCPTHIVYRLPYADAPAAGQTVNEYQPSGKAAKEMKLVYNYTSKLVDNLTSGKHNNPTGEEVNGSTQSQRRAQKVG